MRLQNHPGERVHPVKNSWPRALLDLPTRKATLARAGLTFGSIALVFCVVARGVLSESVEPPPAGVVTFVLAVFVFGLASLGIWGWLVIKGSRARVHEQEAYYRLGGLTELSTEQRAALQLDGINCVGLWSETLETWPCERRLEGQDHQFHTFSLIPKDEALASLDGDWGVLNREAYEETLRHLLSGMHSRSFAGVVAGPDGDAMLRRMQELTGLPSETVSETVAVRDGRPRQLVWAWDLTRVIPLARKAYMSGLIDEAEAWEAILKASEMAHALFDSLEQYQANYRVGHAFWCNDYKQVMERTEWLQSYNDIRPPVRTLAWKKGDYEALDSTARSRLELDVSTSSAPSDEQLH